MFNWLTFCYLLSVNSPSLWKVSFLCVWCHISSVLWAAVIIHLFFMTVHSIHIYRIGLKSLTNIDLMMVHWLLIALFFMTSHLNWELLQISIFGCRYDESMVSLIFMKIHKEVFSEGMYMKKSVWLYIIIIDVLGL